MRMLIFGVVLVLGAMVAAWFQPVFTLAICALILAVFFLARNLEFGVLILVFFFPYLGLVVDFGEWEVFREVPYLKDINAPFIDLYGLLLFVAWLLRSLLNFKSQFSMTNQIPNSKSKTWSLKIDHWSLPHWRSYLLFWLSGLVSLLKVQAINFAVSLKYFARPFTFAYAVFFAPVVNILMRIRNQESGIRALKRVLAVFFVTGIISAINGVLGLFFGAHEGFPRATPFGFWGVNPLGPNHNLLAETLIATAPGGLLLNQESRIRNQGLNWIRYGMFFQWAVALLTFSRTAWIAVAVQAVAYFWLLHRARGQSLALYKHKAKLYLVTLSVVVVGTMLALTMFSETVRGSTLSRFDQARIAWFYWLRSPWIGQGIGTFIPTLWQTRAFLLDYGEPLEAHGILFKLMFEQGLLGLVTFGMFVGAILREIWKKANVPALMIAIGSLTYQLFNTTYYTSKLWVPLALALVISRIYAHSSHNSKMVSG